ncbi:unnamed protein product [Closterium sp. NIES-53]
MKATTWAYVAKFMLGEGEQRSFMVVYVDDILIFSPSSDLVKGVMLKLQDKFKCTALGDVSFYLGLHIERDVEKRCMRVHQRKYLEALAANFGQSEGHVATPFPSGFKCVKGPEEESVGEEERRRFHSLVGSLMYASVNTRPDVAFATGQLARVVQCPNEEQVAAGMRVAKYLGQTPTIGLQYSAAAQRRQKGADGVEPGRLFLTAFSYASYASEPEGMTSVGGFICCVGGGPTAWKIKKQVDQALSSVESEYMALFRAVREIVWQRRLLAELGEEQQGPIPLYCDSRGQFATGADMYAVDIELEGEAEQPIYLDDILVYSRDKQQHLADLEAAFKVLDEHRLLTKGSKCEFFQDRLEFLGHVISEAGVEIDPKTLDTTKAWHPPMNITELQIFFGAGAGDPTESGAAGVGGSIAGGTSNGAGGAEAGSTGTGGAGAGGARAGGTGAGGTGAGGARAVDPGAEGARSQLPLQPASTLHSPSPYIEQSGGLTKRREPVSRPVLPVFPARRVPHSRHPPVPGTHAMALRPFSVPLRVTLLPLESSLPAVRDPDLTFYVLPVLLSLVSLLLLSLTLLLQSDSASPPSVGGECALGTDVLEDKQEDFEYLADAVPRFASMLLALEGDPDAPDIPTPRSYAEVITGPYSSQYQAAMDAEMASWKSTGTYVDAVPPSRANIVDSMWIFRVKRPPGSPPAFKASYVSRGFNQGHGVDYFQTFSPTPKMTTLRVLLHVTAQRDYELHSLDFNTAFLQGSLHEEIWLRRPPGFTRSFPAGTQWSLRRPDYGLRQAPREWHVTLRTTLAALGFAPSTADPSLFLSTNTTLPPFYVLVYVEDLVIATADTEALILVNLELQNRHTCTDLGLSALWLPVLLATAHSSMYQPVALSSTLGRVLRWAWGSCLEDGVQLSSPVTQILLGSSCEVEIYVGAMAVQEWAIFISESTTTRIASSHSPQSVTP